ncbi:DUF1349-domain-containing protein [Basidiobolus meristosporus CBS 931.73]|uniref:DUF1349-domain-containing protein n=1 Tax=Basidiobolus meristosporus CBS 931.73 TaxID=1314790 RepID=A0A1Y1YU33_9FUNG|nr:DUF1349-domain-containing protein [Basidiobolus meristosporus CBS 931.73]|eukprot:ORY01479.1 DUF1349-domain-containing protein [Basidiobolus meristosporus CBS 931.73]
MSTDIQLQWSIPPTSLEREGTTLKLVSSPISDFWRTTTAHRMSGNFGYQRVNATKFKASCLVRGQWNIEYDQAGIMVYLDDHTWIKAGIEYSGGVQYISAVVTNPYSDWALFSSPIDTTVNHLLIELERNGPVVKLSYGAVESASDEEAYRSGAKPLKIFRKVTCFTQEQASLDVGIMACSPKNPDGVSVEIDKFKVDVLE